ncbi:hypothetical protein RMONA_05870 [Rickettsia monacensis]|uniref:Uncharacterized protein n=1 Tax=Rickettsia monacensis TaxID=109232 RepID=A0A0B7J5E0_9RICK|nr:hypothetical protein [Rickettsia monacensis]CDI30129.1 hypothetical protein RMONA_7500 [Rickettsia monacensis IrR/Munich]CEO17539.1 hypothetical protein RMONA_05870 [Rickettsia monacensis]
MLNKNYYKLTDPRQEHRSDNIALEWDDTGMLPPSQNSAVLDKLKEAVDDYISELQNEKLSKDTSPKHVNINNVLPKIRNLFNDELAKDTPPKQVETITHLMQEAIPTPPALSWNTHPIFGDTIKFLKRFKEEIDKFPQDYTKASTIPLYLSNVNRNLGRSEFLASMVSTSQKDERINNILDKLQKISTNCSKISNSDDKFNKEIKESFVEINTILKNIIE